MDLGFPCPRLYKKVSGNESSSLESQANTVHKIYFNTCPVEGNKADDLKASHAP